MEPMEPIEALRMLDQVIAPMPGSRADHVRLQKAVEVIARALAVQQPELKTEPEPKPEAE